MGKVLSPYCAVVKNRLALLATWKITMSLQHIGRDLNPEVDRLSNVVMDWPAREAVQPLLLIAGWDSDDDDDSYNVYSTFKKHARASTDRDSSNYNNGSDAHNDGDSSYNDVQDPECGRNNNKKSKTKKTTSPPNTGTPSPNILSTMAARVKKERPSHTAHQC